MQTLDIEGFLGEPIKIIVDSAGHYMYEPRRLDGFVTESVCAHNLAFDLRMIQDAGFNYVEDFHDTMILARLCGREKLALKELTKQDLEKDILNYKEFKAQYSDPTEQEWLDYCGSHARVTKELFDMYHPAVMNHDMERIYDIERNLIPIITEMQRQGVRLDQQRVADLIKEYESKLELATSELKKMGGDFNLNSNQQVAQVLLSRGAELAFTKGGGNYCVDVSALKKLDDEFATRLLDYREYTKLLGTYLYNWAGKESIHASFNQAGTVTGRFSSSKPNMQNIPKSLRGCFVPPKGMYWASCDYNQTELQILAQFSQDKQMLADFASGIDIHMATSINIAGKEDRPLGKTLNFAIVYGLSRWALALKLGVAEIQAGALQKIYFNTYSGIQSWIKETHKQFDRGEELRTVSGRLLFPRDHRTAVNYIIQGSSADACKSAMLAIRRGGYQPVVQVHDELLTPVYNEDAGLEIRDIMERDGMGQFGLNLPVTAKFLERWE